MLLNFDSTFLYEVQGIEIKVWSGADGLTQGPFQRVNPYILKIYC